MTSKEALKKAWELVHDKYPENNDEIQLVRHAIKTAMELNERNEQALEKAKKQDKLLELYKEVNNNSKELISLAEHDSWSWRLYHEIQVIQDKIKELEK